MSPSRPSKRRQAIAERLRQAELGGGSGFGGGKIYGLVLLLLLLLFVMANYRGRLPRAVEAAMFPPQEPLTAEQVEARRLHLKEQFGGGLFDPPDGEDFVETQGYYRLISSFYQATATTAGNQPMLFDRELAMRDPNAQRGQRVVLRGFSGRNGVWASRLDKPVLHPGGQLTDVWRMVLTDGERDDGVIVDVLEDPGKLDLTRDELQCEAIFWRIVRYEIDTGSRADGKPNAPARREAPYLIARSVTRIEDSSATIAGISKSGLVIFGVAMAGMIGFGIYRLVSQHRRAGLRIPQRMPSSRTPPVPPPAGGDGSPS
jgi:hypothetical protein